jgi:lysozyme
MTKEGIELIKSFEGCRLEAYKCQAGVWTIGYGHTQGVYEGKKITEEEAERLLASDLAKFEMGVRHIVGELSDEKIDALVSLAFNIGLSAFKNSTLVKKLKQADGVEAVCMQFLRWRFVGKKTSKGLLRRRVAEAERYSGLKINVEMLNDYDIEVSFGGGGVA